MLKKLLSALPLYATVCTIILGWWYFAFQTNDTPHPSSSAKQVDNNDKPVSVLVYYPQFNRQDLLNALAGDFSLMGSLIKNWDVDAQILASQGTRGIRRLGRNEFVRSQLLAMQLSSLPKEQLLALNDKARKTSIKDDTGFETDLHRPFHKFLPQTYVAASFLLALVDLDQIVALPGGLRKQEKIFPVSLTSLIPLDIDRFNSEKIYLQTPEIAFVADYSHPTTVQAFRDQGIRLFSIKSINTIQEIQDVLLRLGHVINRPLEAEMLKIFMDAALLAMDNQLLAHKMSWEEKKLSPRILFLSYHTHFAVPTAKTLTWQLLQRLGIEPQVESMPEAIPYKHEWMIPFDQEKIVHYKPDCLIISTPNGVSLNERLRNDKAFAGISSVCRGHMYFVDEDIQQSPTQYIVLAYYDLAQAITRIYP